MIGFPQAKINLGLSIIAKRNDGFHDLESVFYPIPLRDVLEFIPAKTTSLQISGMPLSGSSDNNLVVRALRLLQHDFPQIPEMDILLHKAIPSGAGLGGGSSDAAVMLRMINEFFLLERTPEQLRDYALQLGSDCAFFLQSSPAFVSGRGERLEPVPVDLSACSLLLLHPGISISTAWAYGQVSPARPKYPVKDLIVEPVDSWRGRLENDFEAVVFKKYPELGILKQSLYEAGALYAAMSGSGSSLFGLFEKNSIAPGSWPIAIGQSWLP